MSFVCDMHAHLYDRFPLSGAFRSALLNLKNLCNESRSSRQDSSAADRETHALVLAERCDCHFFRRLSESVGPYPGESFRISRTRDESCIRISLEPEGDLLLIAGRQIATRERLEILSLGIDSDIPDGGRFWDIHKRLLDLGAIPVLNWAPGKWLFERARIVERIIEKASPKELLICDTTLRPTVWPKPRLMKLAENDGFVVVAGSDPLPLLREERLLGSYGVFFDAELDSDFPARSLKGILAKGTKPRIVGCRSGFFEALRRIGGNERLRRKR